MFHRNKKAVRNAFTLLELIVVLIILAILALVAIPTFSKAVEKSRLETQSTETMGYARNAAALKALTQKPYAAEIFEEAKSDYASSVSFGSKALTFDGSPAGLTSLAVSYTEDSFVLANWSEAGCSVVSLEGSSFKVASTLGSAAAECLPSWEAGPGETTPTPTPSPTPTPEGLQAPAVRITNTKTAYALAWDPVPGASTYEVVGTGLNGWGANSSQTRRSKYVYDDSEDVRVRAISADGKVSDWSEVTVNFTGGKAVFVYDLTLPECTTTPNRLVLPRYGSGQDVTTVWGDGTTSWGSTSSHTYETLGRYEVTVRVQIKELSAIGTEAAGDSKCLVAVKEYRGMGTTNFNSAFSGAYNLESIPDDFDTTGATSMNLMFFATKKFSQPLHFDTSEVTSMLSMFSQSNFNAPLDFDMSKVTTIDSMFSGSLFNQPIDWSVPELVTARNAFYNASVMNSPVTLRNSSKLQNVGNMFMYASAFNKPFTLGSTSALTDLSKIFQGASSFNQPLGDWDTSQVTNMRYAFDGATSFRQDLSSWDGRQVTVSNRDAFIDRRYPVEWLPRWS